MVAFAHSRITFGERFQFRTAHSKDSFGFLSLAGESRFNGCDRRGAETGSGFGYGHGIEWIGLSGLKARRKLPFPIAWHAPSADNKATCVGLGFAFGGKANDNTFRIKEP